MNRLLTSVLGLALLVFIYACKGPQGDVGPAGPQGVVGAAGATGPQGTSGMSGITGMVTSPWSATVGPKTWTQDPTDKTYFYLGFKLSSITQAVIDRGLVMVYARFADDPTTAYPLPNVFDDGVESFVPYMDGKDGWLQISQDYIKGTTPDNSISQYRWVIIPPQPGGRMPAIDWKNYNEVKKALNLTD